MYTRAMSYRDDSPISDLSEDLLNRADFVHQLTAMLNQRRNRSSITIGVYGAWGCGKTSALNLVKRELEKSAIIVDFNPWAFGNQNLALREFLGVLANSIQDCVLSEHNQVKPYWKIPVIGQYLKKRACDRIFSIREELGDILSRYADLAIDVSAELLRVKALTLLKSTTKSLDHSGHLSSMKQKLEVAISKCERPVVVFIDDVDRLDREEIFQVFKIIKCVLNFKGITYVLAFDDYAVGKALNSRFEDGTSQDAGRKYLEKIIQVPLRLPALRREDLDNMLMNAIADLLFDNGIALETGEGERDTPRAIHRYVNALEFLLPSIKGEVNLVDFLILEIVRIFQPEVYARVFSEKKLLVDDHQDFGMYLDDTDSYNKLKDNFSSENLLWLEKLFPRIDDSKNQRAVLRDSSGTPGKRIYLSEYFDKCFSYGVPPDSVSDNAILDLVKLNNESEINKSLTMLLTNSKNQDIIFKKIKDNIELCANPRGMAFAILERFSMLHSGKTPFSLPILQTASLLVVNLTLCTLDPDQMLSRIVGNCDNPEHLFYLVRGMQLFLSKEEGQTKFPKLWEYLQPIIAGKIQKIADKEVLHSEAYPHGCLLYKYWADFSSRDTTNKYLKENLKSANDVLAFLTQYLAILQSEEGFMRGNLEKETFDSISRVADTNWMYRLLVKAYPQYGKECQYVSFGDPDDGINTLGKEKTDEFRSILAQQFIALAQEIRAQKS